ncbi:MAG: 1,4-alpha-glucan branching enzyme, partial [Mariprofundaceae bacterium]|nr:1,4-alpha-glucan branching enzyme [Mariprofundaceae bacterium]
MTSIPTSAWPIIEARSHDPFSYLGCHLQDDGSTIIRVFKPRVKSVSLLLNPDDEIAMERLEGTDVFTAVLTADTDASDYRLRLRNGEGHDWEQDDPYRFPPLLGDMDLHLIGEGNHFEKYNVLGAHPCKHAGVAGVSFAVWAPSASRVSVVGNFNHWDGREHPMRVRGSSGIWELFIPSLTNGEVYKYEIRTQSGELLEKTDPYGQQMEVRPNTASVVHDANQYQWQDAEWVSNRPRHQALD